MRRLLAALGESYGLAAGPAAGDRGRRAGQRAYGLLSRSQALGREIEDSLGPQLEPVTVPLSTIRAEAYPGGLGRPPPGEDGEPPPPLRPPPAQRVERLVRASAAALEARFGLSLIRRRPVDSG